MTREGIGRAKTVLEVPNQQISPVPQFERDLFQKVRRLQCKDDLAPRLGLTVCYRPNYFLLEKNQWFQRS